MVGSQCTVTQITDPLLPVAILKQVLSIAGVELLPVAILYQFEPRPQTGVAILYRRGRIVLQHLFEDEVQTGILQHLNVRQSLVLSRSLALYLVIR